MRLPELYGEEFQLQRKNIMFHPFEYNGDTKFSSLLVDYGPRRHGLYFDTKDGLKIRSVDRTTNKVTQLEFDEKPPVGWLVIGSKKTSQMHLVPLNESDIHDSNYAEDIAVSKIFVKNHAPIRDVDMDVYAVVTLNPDTQSLSVYHSADSISPVDFHPGARMDNDIVTANVPENYPKDVIRVGSSERRSPYKLSAQERKDIRRQKGAERPEHHGVKSASSEGDYGKAEVERSRKKRNRIFFEEDITEALEYPEIGARIPEPNPLSQYTHQSHSIETTIKFPSNEAPDNVLSDRYPDPPIRPRLTNAERREFRQVKKEKNFGRK